MYDHTYKTFYKKNDQKKKVVLWNLIQKVFGVLEWMGEYKF